MTGTFWGYLVAAILVLAVNAGAVYLAWRALFKDRAAGRRRCPSCWHDLSGTPGMTCGECGFFGQQEADFARTRRQWNIAWLAILTCVGVAGWTYWKLDNRNWATYLPTPMLTLMLPLRSDAGSVIYQEIMRRAQADRITYAQWASILERSAEGDWWSKPPDDRWIRTYGKLIETGRWRLNADPEAEWDEDACEALLNIPPHIDLSTRSVWPIGAAPRVRLRMRDWWPLGGPCRLRITPQVDGAETFQVKRAGRPFLWYDYSFPVHGLTTDAESVMVEIEVHRDMTAPPADGHGPPAPSEWRAMTFATLPVKVRFDDDVETGLTAAVETELAQAVENAFGRGAVRWESGPAPVRFFFNPQQTYTPAFEDTAIGVHVDVMKDDALARRLDIWWLAGTIPDDRGTGWESLNEDTDLLNQIAAGGDWVMRVTGDPNLALRAGDAVRYWDGEFEVPLRVQENPGVAPEPLWTNVDGDEDGT